MTSSLRDFLEIPYDELEELNLQMKALRLARTPVDILREERCRYLADEKRIKAVTVCCSSMPLPRRSARWALPMKKTTRKSPRHSLR